MEKIRYKKEKVYGRDMYYILDTKFKENYQILTGMKTMTDETMGALKRMGFEFEQVLN